MTPSTTSRERTAAWNISLRPRWKRSRPRSSAVRRRPSRLERFRQTCWLNSRLTDEGEYALY